MTDTASCEVCEIAQHHECDLLVIGAGPAGLAAAVNAASEGLGVIVLDRWPQVGGQARSSSRIENYLGFPSGLTGEELASSAYEQAVRFGADIHVNADVIDLRLTDDGRHQVMCAHGTVYVCRAVLIATGVTYRRLDAPGVDELTGRGIFYGISPSEAEDYRGRRVFVVGGANSAGQAALHLDAHGAVVTILTRSPLTKAMSTYLIDRIEASAIMVLESARLAAASGRDNKLRAITVSTPAAIQTFNADGVFVFIGAEPSTSWAPGLAVDRQGFILTGNDVPITVSEGSVPGIYRVGPHSDEHDWLPQHLEASIPGVFVAGDVRSSSVKRVSAAAGEGSMAVAMIHRYLARHQVTTPA